MQKPQFQKICNHLFLLVVIFVSGCQSANWNKYGVSQTEKNRDIYECRSEASRIYTPIYVTESDKTGMNNSLSNSTINCYSTPGLGNNQTMVQCNQVPQMQSQPVKMIGSTRTNDINADKRDSLFSDCMRAKGYDLVYGSLPYSSPAKIYSVGKYERPGSISTDNFTIENGILFDNKNKLMWLISRENFESDVDWLSAHKELTYGGYYNWRLPTPAELYTFCLAFSDYNLLHHTTYWSNAQIDYFNAKAYDMKNCMPLEMQKIDRDVHLLPVRNIR